MELAVFVGGASEMAHDFRPNRALRRNYELNVMFQRLFKKKAAGLSVFLGERGKLAIKARIHFQADLFCKCFGHALASLKRSYARELQKSREF